MTKYIPLQVQPPNLSSMPNNCFPRTSQAFGLIRLNSQALSSSVRFEWLGKVILHGGCYCDCDIEPQEQWKRSGGNLTRTFCTELWL